MLTGKKILLVITGGIAAYKALDLVRQLKEQRCEVVPILTKAGAEFVTPLSLSALSGQSVHTDLFHLTEDKQMGHIELARWPDIILVAPATADFIGKVRWGLADDLASTTILASNRPLMLVPAMNPKMWENPATKENLIILQNRGVEVIGPGLGAMACGEVGYGRMAEVDEITHALLNYFQGCPTLQGKKVLITAGPTHEPIDPVRYITNHSSGKQGHAFARACHRAGMEVILVSGPTHEPEVDGVERILVETAEEMMQACIKHLPVDIAICTAAVADWRVKKIADQKIKKKTDQMEMTLTLVKNPDILKTISTHKRRPNLVIGFAAETENVIPYAKQKRKEKKCDWIVANDVSADHSPFGKDRNTVHILDSADQVETLADFPKIEIAMRLLKRMSDHFQKSAPST